MKAAVSLAKPLPLQAATVSSVTVLENCLDPWRILGCIDAHVTSNLLDNVFIKSHKLCISENIYDLILQKKYKPLFELVQKAYLQSMEFISFVPTPMYGTKSSYTELAVVANDHIKSKTDNPGLNGFTALIAEEELTNEMEFSVFAGTPSQQTRIMLGPGSFVSHDCSPNCRSEQIFERILGEINNNHKFSKNTIRYYLIRY